MAETTLWLDQDRLYTISSEQGRVSAVTGYPLTPGSDPIAGLASLPLGPNMGKVSIVLDHNDLLLRPMMQPPADDERIDRMVRFEAGGLLNSDEPFGVDWQKLPVGSGEDLRLGTLTCRSRLLEQLAAAVKEHGGSIHNVIPTGIALYHAANSEPGGALELDEEEEGGVIALLHIGPNSSTVTLVINEAPVISRTHEGGFQAMVKAIATARNIDEETATTMLASLRGTPPDELADAIDREIASVANLVNQNLRMVGGQLRLEGMKLRRVLLSGKSLPGMTDKIGERLRVPCRPINPWAGKILTAPSAELDSASQLPSPWAPAAGMIGVTSPFLDAMRPVQAARKAFWRTKGALRSAVILAAALLITTLANLYLQQSRAGSGLERLSTLVPQAKSADNELSGKLRKIDSARLQLRFFHQTRAPGRILGEIQNALAVLIDPGSMPVQIDVLRMNTTSANEITIAIEGSATYLGSLSSSEVLNQLKVALPERYPSITRITENPVGLGKADSQPFSWVLTIPVHG